MSWLTKKSNNKGFSLVELLVTIAILSIVTLAVGSAMVSSAKNYSRGNLEVSLQQQSQTTANIISNLVLDATALSYNSTTKELEIKQVITGKDATYTIKQVGDKLQYKLVGIAVEGENEFLDLADNVTTFEVDTSNYVSNKTVAVTLGFTVGDQDFKTTYDMTSRNGTGNGSESTAVLSVRSVVLEPGDEFVFNSVSNREVVFGNLENNSDSNSTWVYRNDSEAKVKVGMDETGYMTFSVATADGAVTDVVYIYIRRVAEIGLEVSYTGAPVEANTSYRIGTNFSSVANTTLYTKGNADNGQYNYWEFEDITFSVKAQDASGAVIATNQLVKNINMHEELLDPSTINAADVFRNSYITFDLARKLAVGEKITITATAKRPSHIADSEAKGYGKVNANTEEVTKEYVIENKADIRRGDTYDVDNPGGFVVYGSSLLTHAGRWYVFDRVSNRGMTNKDDAVTFAAHPELVSALTLPYSLQIPFVFTRDTRDNNQNITKQIPAFDRLEPQYSYCYQVCWIYANSQASADAILAAHFTEILNTNTVSYVIAPVSLTYDRLESSITGMANNTTFAGSMGIGTRENPLQIIGKYNGSMTNNKLVYEVDACASNYAQEKMEVKVEVWNGHNWENYGGLNCNPQYLQTVDGRHYSYSWLNPQAQDLDKIFKLSFDWKSDQVTHPEDNHYPDYSTTPQRGVVYLTFVSASE